MKKIYTTPEYKKKHKSKLDSLNKKNKVSNKPSENNFKNHQKKVKIHNELTISIPSPSDFRLIDNTNKCLEFFREIREGNNIFLNKHRKFIKISLKNVTQIDYSAICVLKAIVGDLKYDNIFTQCEFPDDPRCKKDIFDSDFLNDFYEKGTQKFKKAEKSDFIFFEKGCGKLSDLENRKIGALVKNVIAHLTGEEKHFNPVKTILLEICGNSIEHAYAKNKHWLLGVKYEEKKVVFAVSDVGKGILETLHRKFTRKTEDFFKNKSNLEILKGAFDQRYGSSTLEINRNKGLPAVKEKAKNNDIIHLIVLTNNVILHFDNDDLSQTFDNGSARFKGTLYQWEMTKECIK